jgi:hypothetical protein
MMMMGILRETMAPDNLFMDFNCLSERRTEYVLDKHLHETDDV